MRKFSKITLSLILILTMILGLCACGNEHDEISDFNIYYVNSQSTKLIKEGYDTRTKNLKKLVFELLDKLSSNGKEVGSIRAIPKEVTVNKFNIEDGNIAVDFGNQYLKMANGREVLCRAAVVLTLVQISSVNSVSITVEGKPIVKKDGTKIGVMNAASFAGDLAGRDGLYAKSDFVLYFGNENGTKLKRYVIKNGKYGEMSKEEYIVKKLIAGPKRDGYRASISPRVRLLNVKSSENICYVNFNQSFLDEQSDLTAQLTIYSIVDSLSELKNVHKVQIMVNSESNLMYRNTISLRDPFLRNLDYVE